MTSQELSEKLGGWDKIYEAAFKWAKDERRKFSVDTLYDYRAKIGYI